MNTQTSQVLRKVDCVPTQQMHPIFFLDRAPNEVLDGFVKDFCNPFRYFDVTHNMGRDSTKSGLGKDSSTSHGQAVGFPSSESLSHGVDQVLEVTIDGTITEDREA